MGRAENRKIDLDARRKARAAEGEANGEPVEVVFADTKFELPPELPWRFASLLSRGDADGALRAAFTRQRTRTDKDGEPENYDDDSEYDRFLTLNPMTSDVLALVEDLSQAYGLSEGESSASASSS